jgi:hypothetical protein
LGTAAPFYTEYGAVPKFIYDDVIYYVGASNLFIYNNHIIYLEDNTTDELKAIQDKYKNAFKNTTITVTDYEKTVEEYLNQLNEEYESYYNENPLDPMCSEYESAEEYATAMMNSLFYAEDAIYGYLMDFTDNNMYSISMGEDFEALFVAVKDSDKVTKQSHVTSDLTSNITISTDKTLSLDTLIKVAKLTSGEDYEKIVDILKVTNSEMFDLKLFSKSINDYITELDDGTFEVKIPITESLRNKNLVVYYVDDDDKKVEYKVTVKDGYAIFNTDHFSIYTLAEKAIDNPQTGDNIGLSILLGSISLIGIIGCGLYLNKKKRFN